MDKLRPACGRIVAAATLLICILASAAVQAQDSIGRVILTTGVVTATNAAGVEREVARGSEIFAEESITTSNGGSAKLRFTDGGVVSLDADSVFTVNAYVYDGEGGAPDSMIMTMTRGTLRTLTGVIGDDPADTYEMNTPFASIGVRGTEYALVVEPSGRVRVFVFDGSVAVSPGGGGVPTVVGLTGDSDAVDVSDANTVRELSADEIAASPEIQAVINRLDTTPVSQEAVDSLPAPDLALVIQRNQNQQAQEEALAEIQSELVGEDAAGLLVDATGQAISATDETTFIQARTIVIISISENDDNAFDVTVRENISVSAN
jgi:hypothetical protein